MLFRWDDVTVVDGNGRGRDDKVNLFLITSKDLTLHSGAKTELVILWVAASKDYNFWVTKVILF